LQSVLPASLATRLDCPTLGDGFRGGFRRSRLDRPVIATAATLAGLPVDDRLRREGRAPTLQMIARDGSPPCATT
jgi:hypothetical protein